MRSQFLRSISSREYAELIALSNIERIGLERTDWQATVISKSMGADVSEELFRVFPERTAQDEFDALAGVAIRGSDSES